MRCFRIRVAWAVVTLMAWSPALWAQASDNKAAAEALFDQGIAQLKAGQSAQACISLERSQAIDAAVGTLLYLAECYEVTGRNASAWATFREAASMATASGQADRAKVGQARAEKLRPTLSHVTLVAGNGGGALEGYQIRRDGQVVLPALLAVPVPVDPGAHALEVTAPGYQSWTGSFQLAAGGQHVSVTIPELQPLAEQPVAPEPSVPVAPEEPPAPVVEPDLTWTWILGGAGIAAVGAGVVLGLDASAKDDDAAGFCEDERCFDREGEELSKDARTSALVANVAYGVGGAALAGALLLYYLELQPDEGEPTTASAGLNLELAPQGAQLGLKGSF